MAASDVNRQALDELAAELSADAAGRIMAVTMDVTDEASVAAGFDEVACAWGGVDLIVVNAGVALVASLTEMKLEAFRKLEKVNVEGSLLTLAEAGRRLCLQGTGGNIVLVSTKNVFAPGAQFGDYRATKAAAHQLARIASLELATIRNPRQHGGAGRGFRRGQPQVGTLGRGGAVADAGPRIG